MKLGILCTMTNGFGKKGYYNTQEIGLGRALWRLGHDVTIYKCVMRGEKPETRQLESGLTIHYLSVPSIGNAQGILNPEILAKDLEGILCFADNQLFLPRVYRYCKKHGIMFVPYIGTLHSVYEKSIRGAISNFLLSIGSLPMYKKCPVLAKTQGAMEELRKLGFSDVTLAPVGLDDGVLNKSFHQADRTELRRKFGMKADEVVICSVARLEEDKRPLELVSFFERIKEKKNFRLVMVGVGPMEALVDSEIKKRGLEDRVLRLKRVPYEDMWEIYTMSDYYLNFNYVEIFGMAVMEAVYYCTSVAACKAPGPCLTLKNMPGHKICDNDEEVEKWLLSEYPSVGELNQSSVKMLHDFSWERTANQFIRLVSDKK